MFLETSGVFRNALQPAINRLKEPEYAIYSDWLRAALIRADTTATISVRATFVISMSPKGVSGSVYPVGVKNMSMLTKSLDEDCNRSAAPACRHSACLYPSFINS